MKLKRLSKLANHYAGQPCTLDGTPATITGRQNAHATILTDCRACTWSWRAVDVAMRHEGGRFVTGEADYPVPRRFV